MLNFIEPERKATEQDGCRHNAWAIHDSVTIFRSVNTGRGNPNDTNRNKFRYKGTRATSISKHATVVLEIGGGGGITV